MLTLTIRIHDSEEKTNPEKSTQWVVLEVPRSDLSLSDVDFAAKYLLPAVANLKKISQ